MAFDISGWKQRVFWRVATTVPCAAVWC